MILQFILSSRYSSVNATTEVVEWSARLAREAVEGEFEHIMCTLCTWMCTLRTLCAHCAHNIYVHNVHMKM